MSFQPPNLPIGKVWVSACDALLCVSHTIHSALESGQEAGSCRLITAYYLTIFFGSVNHQEFSISILSVLEVMCVYIDTVYIYWITARYSGVN